VVTENSVRSEATEVPNSHEIMVATTMGSLFAALFVWVVSSFRTRAALQAESSRFVTSLRPRRMERKVLIRIRGAPEGMGRRQSRGRSKDGKLLVRPRENAPRAQGQGRNPSRATPRRQADRVAIGQARGTTRAVRMLFRSRWRTRPLWSRVPKPVTSYHSFLQ
jgi:hypothetical protein